MMTIPSSSSVSGVGVVVVVVAVVVPVLFLQQLQVLPNFINNVEAFPASSSSSSSSKWHSIHQELQIDERRKGNTDAGRGRGGGGVVVIDSVFDPSTPDFSTTRPTLFRERHGWCPYSERVWLTLELLGVEYDTIKIDNTGHGPRPSYFKGGQQTPQIRWPSTGKQQGESMDLVKELDTKYGNGRLYRRHGNHGHNTNTNDVQECIDAFRSIFPSRARPSSRAAFLFQSNGEPLFKSVFEETLQKTEELLRRRSRQADGPFFCGTEISAADIAWAPFLERYRYQLPCLHGHDQLDPYDAGRYPNLVRWYDAMDCRFTTTAGISTTSATATDDAAPLPVVYPCVVKGDASSWRKVLTMAGYGNAGNVPTAISSHMDEIVRSGIEVDQARTVIDFDVWTTYKESSRRRVVANTPHEEAASIIVENRQKIVDDIMKQQQQQQRQQSRSKYAPYLEALSSLSSRDELDDLLLQLAILLKDTGRRRLKEPPPPSSSGDDDNISSKISPEIIDLASFLDERMCVPRDMGCMPASSIKLIASRAYTHTQNV